MAKDESNDMIGRGVATPSHRRPVDDVIYRIGIFRHRSDWGA
jgi:hypothetical protein